MAHSEELLEQAIETFKTVWSAKGTYSATIHRLYSHYNPNDLLFSNSVIFAGLQKISRLDSKDELFLEIKKNVSLVVVDEAHKSLAVTYERSISHLVKNNNAKLVGVTATPGRSYELSSENRERKALQHAFEEGRNVIAKEKAIKGFKINAKEKRDSSAKARLVVSGESII